MADSLTIGVLALTCTFECISVVASFTDDDNANATAAVEYKAATSGTWLPAYTPFIDRRATIGANNNSVNYKQARISIVGLTPNTVYDVRVTWTDPDGVSGTNPVTGSITTRTWSPPLGGDLLYVDSAAPGGGDGSSDSPYNSITTAAAGASAGDTVKMKGNFGPSTFNLNGASGAWIRFEPWDAPLSIGSGNSTSLSVGGKFLWFSGFTVNASSGLGNSIAGSSINLTSTCDYVIFDNLLFPDAVLSSSALTGAPTGAAAIRIAVGAAHIAVKSCQIYTSNTHPTNVYGGVYFKGDGNPTGGHIIADCTISGKFYDGIGGEGNGWGDGPVNNSDICRNVVMGSLDDGIECEGDNINVRIWGNNVSNITRSTLAIAGTHVGPLYVFRNFLQGAPIAAVKLGNNSPGPHYFFHNTISAASSVLYDAGGTPYSESGTYRNNILKTTSYCIENGGRTNTYDYNLYDPATTCVRHWNPQTTDDTYVTLGGFTSGTSQEIHGVQAVIILNNDGTLKDGSAAINAGVPIDNFNGPNSAWPYSGPAPDIGAFEYILTSLRRLGRRLKFKGLSPN